MTHQNILERAAERARAAGKKHAGDLTPEEAHQLLREHPKAKLVDVRSHPELDFAGFIEGCCHVPWQLYPGMTPNPHFDEEIRRVAQPDEFLLLLCRTGGRSLAAAEHLAEQGYQHCFNILGGMEGKPDASGQRGKIEGWKASGLPWKHK
ncbi:MULTISPECIES: rhodanese-like domain-containing protein [Acidithiobacillus]|uniref:Rhodanese-like protein n=3 Tax=Acidithiobacillus caldus TaxID=33059 RepID=F9ZTB2_ACICS|nr:MULTISPECIES: rhodanese-like domain-containing protein [Acidithiobacillus]AEK56952.1 rhodanese-like protein [Acidithiobacillus caldus SM-1]AIA54219.1 Rhodanese domain protein [Acidithiobacillus caldus ATCC 51756]AUW33909.1 rhodanese-like domain-containing protein [Acidithiobacillus caldus]MBU2728619.1 rhodanese-like domain-containing protein [Acidithiobacillus caldus]MBU2736923.1 rhodanese-like domain-containing protein [Acidithiobacillus caldus ATCC 51756]